MTKLESGAIAPNVALHDIGEIVGSALRRASRSSSRHKVELELAPICRCSNSMPCCSSRCCSISSTMPRNMRPPETMIRIQGWRSETRSAAGARRGQRHSAGRSRAHIRQVLPRAEDATRCAPAPGWARHLARLRRSDARHHRRGKPLRPQRRRVHHQPADPAQAPSDWTLPHERSPAPRAGGRRRAADTQIAAHGPDRAGLPDAGGAERQGRSRAAQREARPDHPRSRPPRYRTATICCARFARATRTCPIVVLSSRGDEATKVAGARPGRRRLRDQAVRHGGAARPHAGGAPSPAAGPRRAAGLPASAICRSTSSAASSSSATRR